MRFLTRSLVALFLMAVSFAALGYAGFTLYGAIQARSESASGPAQGRERVFTVRAITIEPSRVTPTLSAFGEVRTRRSLELRGPVSGRIIEVAEGFEEGAEVRAGQVLFRIDPAEAESSLALAAADLDRAKADLADAMRATELAGEDVAAARAQYDLRQTALERRRGLAERGVATEAALEEAELALASARQAWVGRRQAEATALTRLDQAKVSLSRAEITHTEAKRRLQDTTVTATFDGTASNVRVTEGRQVNSNEELGLIIDPNALEVAVRISTAQYLRLLDEDGDLISTDAEIALEVAGYEITSPGRVLRASATVEQGQSGRQVFVELGSPRGFRPGDFVTLRLREPALEQVAQVPAAAVNAAGNVMVINADNRLEAYPVAVLRRQGGDVIIRTDGLEGREIVREITPMLGAGIRVRPQRESADGEVVEETEQMVTLDDERRASLIARVESNTRMPEQVRARIVAQLSQEQVPADVIERLEAGGGPRGGG